MSKFRTYEISKFTISTFQNSKFQNYKIQKIRIIQLRIQNFKIQHFKIQNATNQNFKILTFQHFNITNCKCSNCTARLPFWSTKKTWCCDKTNFIWKIRGNPLPEICVRLFTTLCTGRILKTRNLKIVFLQHRQKSKIEICSL